MPQYDWHVVDPWHRVVRHELMQLLEPRHEGAVEDAVRKLITPIDGTCVAVWKDGTEALQYKPGGTYVDATLTTYRIDVGKWVGAAIYEDRVAYNSDLEAWLDEHSDELDWIHPKWREQLDPVAKVE